MTCKRLHLLLLLFGLWPHFLQKGFNEATGWLKPLRCFIYQGLVVRVCPMACEDLGAPTVSSSTPEGPRYSPRSLSEFVPNLRHNPNGVLPWTFLPPPGTSSWPMKHPPSTEIPAAEGQSTDFTLRQSARVLEIPAWEIGR